MFQYIYSFFYDESLNNVENNSIKNIKTDDLIDVKNKLKKTNILKKQYYIPSIKELDITKQKLKKSNTKFVIKSNDLIKIKSTLKKTIIKNEPIRNLFLEELKKAKEVIYNKKNIN